MLLIMNLSLSTKTISSTFKTAVRKPLLKKPSLEPKVVSSYWQISNIPFYWKEITPDDKQLI